MKIEIIWHLATFIILCLVQVLVLNHIDLFGCATPLLYVYFILMFRRDFPKWAVLLWSFLLGLCIDMFSNTPGMAASSCTIVGLLQPYVLNLFLTRDSEDDLKPSMTSLGVGKYLWYMLILVLLYNVLFYTTETFSFFNWQQWLMDIGGSTAITFLTIAAIENLRRR